MLTKYWKGCLLCTLRRWMNQLQRSAEGEQDETLLCPGVRTTVRGVTGAISGTRRKEEKLEGGGGGVRGYHVEQREQRAEKLPSVYLNSSSSQAQFPDLYLRREGAVPTSDPSNSTWASLQVHHVFISPQLRLLFLPLKFNLSLRPTSVFRSRTQPAKITHQSHSRKPGAQFFIFLVSFVMIYVHNVQKVIYVMV